MDIESISLKLSNRLGDRLNKTQEEKSVLNYGLFVVIHTSIAIIITLLVGVITNTLIEITIISIVMSSIKRNSGGVHSSSPERCLITGLVLTLIMSFVCKYLLNILNQEQLIITISSLIIFSYYVIYKKCPVPSKNKPLKNEKRRKILRRNCLRLLFIYVVIIFTVYTIDTIKSIEILEVIGMAISLGIILQVIALTKFGNKLINLFEVVFNFMNIN